MSYLHSHNILHRCLKPSTIYLNEILFPKIGDFGLSMKFYNSNSLTVQSISGLQGSPVYSAPEVLQYDAYSKASDVYSFGFIVYELLMNEVPFKSINNFNKIITEIVTKNNRPELNDSIPKKFKELIEKCWDQDPNQRPSFDDISFYLRMDQDFISDKIDKESYQKYIEFIDEQTQNNACKLIIEDEDKDVNPSEINKNVNSPETFVFETNEDPNSSETNENVNSPETNENLPETFVSEINENVNSSETNEIVNSPETFVFETNENVNSSFKNEIINEDEINRYISSKRMKELMDFLNSNFDYESTNDVFNRCYNESKELFIDLCNEGILINNPVAHHKYALSLILNDFNDSKSYSEKVQIHNYEEAVIHLKESIKQGFNTSYFILARIYYEFYKNYHYALKYAQEGSTKNEKYSICLFGYFVAHGIGINKDFMSGIKIVLESNAEDFYQRFATDICVYHIKLNEKENSKEYENIAFKWFERAFNLRQTKTTINNFGICFLKGIGVDKNIEKAKEILSKGNSKSLMHMHDFISEENDQNISFQSIFGQTDYIDCCKKIAEKGNVKAQEFLFDKYSKENDSENAYKFMVMLIKSRNCTAPIKYAINLYNSKNYKQAFNYFRFISVTNHPIAKYFIGVMKFNGQGCTKNREEAFKILKILSDNGIERATNFIEDNF